MLAKSISDPPNSKFKILSPIQGNKHFLRFWPYSGRGKGGIRLGFTSPSLHSTWSHLTLARTGCKGKAESLACCSRQQYAGTLLELTKRDVKAKGHVPLAHEDGSRDCTLLLFFLCAPKKKAKVREVGSRFITRSL